MAVQRLLENKPENHKLVQEFTGIIRVYLKKH
jgi:hypothetical protein